MPKLRKMLGDVNSQESNALMRLIETQNKTTLAAWAIDYVKENYLDLYEAQCREDTRLRETIAVCQDYLKGAKKLKDIKPAIKEAGQIAREAADDPVAQAAARAIAAACGVIQTPTNALGFVFYGAAASAYSQAGLSESLETYDKLALDEFKQVLDSLEQAAVDDEPNPVKINWHC